MSEFLPEWLVHVRDVLETLNQGVIITDECPRIIYSNAEFQGMVGRSDDELVGQYAKDLFPPEDVPFLLSQIGLGRINGQARFEFYLPQLGGGRLPVVVAARQLEDPEGRLFAVVTFTDIAEQKSAELDLRRANVLLETRERAMEEDLRLAARVQQSLAPKCLAWGAASVETYYQAARTIGGDYGLVTPGDDYLTMLVCDVSGHGIGSALVANRIYTETVSLIEGGAALTPMLQHLNRFVMHNLGSSFMYFTLAAARLRRDGRSLEFSVPAIPRPCSFARDMRQDILSQRAPSWDVLTTWSARIRRSRLLWKPATGSCCTQMVSRRILIHREKCSASVVSQNLLVRHPTCRFP